MKILVTGGSNGIGFSLVSILLDQGHDVTFTYHKDAEKAETLEKKGAHKIQYTFGESESLRKLLLTIQSEKFQGLVNNAGRLHEQTPFADMPPDRFLSFLREGMDDFVKISHEFVVNLRNSSEKGSIVNVLSSYTLGMPPARISAYTTLKYSMLGLTRALAVEMIQYGIRVNAVSPSMTRTNLLSDLSERFIELAEAGFPMKRLANPEETASVIAFLLSEEASYINGVNLPITGGIVC